MNNQLINYKLKKYDYKMKNTTDEYEQKLYEMKLNYYKKIGGGNKTKWTLLKNTSKRPFDLYIENNNINFSQITNAYNLLMIDSEVLCGLFDFEDFRRILIYHNIQIIPLLINSFLNDKNVKMMDICLKLTGPEYVDLWLIKERKSIPSLLYVMRKLVASEYKKECVSFFMKMTLIEHAKIWSVKIKMIGFKKEFTLLYVALLSLCGCDYKEFWNECNKKFKNILYISDDAFITTSPFIVNEEEFSLFNKSYDPKKKSEYTYDYYVSAHGKTINEFFKIPPNIKIIFLTKSNTPTYIEDTSQYISYLKNELNVTMNMCAFNGILRTYNGGDVVQNVEFGFSDERKFKSIVFGIMKNPDKKLSEHFQCEQCLTSLHINNILKNSTDQDEINRLSDIGKTVVNDLGHIFKSTLYHIVMKLYGFINSDPDKIYTIVVNSCRTNYNPELQICKYICNIKKNEHCSRYESLCKCNDNNNNQNHLTRNSTLASLQNTQLNTTCNSTFENDLKKTLKMVTITNNYVYQTKKQLEEIYANIKNYKIISKRDFIFTYAIMASITEQFNAKMQYINNA